MSKGLTFAVRNILLLRADDVRFKSFTSFACTMWVPATLHRLDRASARATNVLNESFRTDGRFCVPNPASASSESLALESLSSDEAKSVEFVLSSEPSKILRIAVRVGFLEKCDLHFDLVRPCFAPCSSSEDDPCTAVGRSVSQEAIRRGNRAIGVNVWTCHISFDSSFPAHDCCHQHHYH